MAGPRTLVTIGDLRAQPLFRSKMRRMRMSGMGFVDMGSATADTAGPALQAASADLLAQTDAHGAPPEEMVDPATMAFQQAWNADPANSGDQLVVDGKYGPLTYGAQNATTGGMASPVNGGSSPLVTPTPATPATPTAPAAASTSHLGIWLLLAAAAGGAYLLFRKKGRRGGARRRATSTAIEIRSNPRRRRNAELIP